jgi:glycosyltransferase involved in cell wall biosynthesis
VVSPRKRQIELLKHLSSLREEIAFDFTFIGKADPSEDYARKFRVLLDEMHAKHGGFQHREYLEPRDFIELYDESDAMVHFSSEESFGLTFAEALSRNLTLFASDVGAVRQIADGIADCRIFGAGDFGGLIGALRAWLLANPHGGRRNATPNSLVFSRYHPGVIAEKHLEVYRMVISRNRKQ